MSEYDDLLPSEEDQEAFERGESYTFTEEQLRDLPLPQHEGITVQTTAIPDEPADEPTPPGEPRFIREGETLEQYLIDQWGSEDYFSSALYAQWQQEKQRQAKLEPLRKEFLKTKART